MWDLTQLSDDDLRAALFDVLVERLDAKARDDASIVMVNRMPTVLAVSRRGNLLTLSQGLGLWLLRGDLKAKDRRERLRTFTVSRATIQSRLTITPDGIEGTPDEILDRIVAMFLEWTATTEEGQPAPFEPIQESTRTPLSTAVERPSAPGSLQQSEAPGRSAPQKSQPAARAAESRPMVRDAEQERRAISARSTQERRSATPRTPPESRPAPVEATPSPPGPVRDMTILRTYQLLFETARQQLDRAKALPAGNEYLLISAGVFVAFTAEAFLNDLGSRVIPSWSQLQRLDPREKAEVLSIELFNEKVDWSVRPFQSVAAALGFRRALAHAHAETLFFDQARTADRMVSEVPRTRQTAWREHCDVGTIQRWISDVHLLIEHFCSGHDPTEIAAAGWNGRNVP